MFGNASEQNGSKNGMRQEYINLIKTLLLSNVNMKKCF